MICVEADGLTLEIGVAPGAAALDGKLGPLIASAITAANKAAGQAHGAVTVVVDDDERVRALNKLWRGQDKPTNVLSFPSPDTQPGPERTLGDIAISYETAAREAEAEDKSFADHIAHLSVHGFLHLLGYDHESDADAEEMEGLEREILARIGVADPYVAHEAEG
ncbi:MAG: rRNA maturation RNase YbeY [Xanthobacteraceae bacterium]|nr:rRNA maturation RNase YbeY [Xanthobacteraceae bacterium]